FTITDFAPNTAYEDNLPREKHPPLTTGVPVVVPGPPPVMVAEPPEALIPRLAKPAETANPLRAETVTLAVLLATVTSPDADELRIALPKAVDITTSPGAEAVPPVTVAPEEPEIMVLATLLII